MSRIINPIYIFKIDAVTRPFGEFAKEVVCRNREIMQGAIALVASVVICKSAMYNDTYRRQNLSQNFRQG